jgi:hypothetical protein
VTVRDPRSYTPKHLAEKILTSRSALEGERKQVTILFADVRGSTELASELDPEEWHRIMDRFFQILAEGVHRFEGTVNEYRGDGIMALFGAPIAQEDHAQRACYAALHLRDALRRYADELRIGKGISFSVFDEDGPWRRQGAVEHRPALIAAVDGESLPPQACANAPKSIEWRSQPPRTLSAAADCRYERCGSGTGDRCRSSWEGTESTDIGSLVGPNHRLHTETGGERCTRCVAAQGAARAHRQQRRPDAHQSMPMAHPSLVSFRTTSRLRADPCE